MKHETLHKVLSCKALPSLPAVALRVIEQTSDPNIKLAELASTIQNDQGLTAKVLKTVNSSFYGLRSPCSTINRALVLMGLAPVKTLVLGFSLVNAVNDRKNAVQFDYVSYWRRGLYTAVASKAIAEAAGRKWGDEAFLAGLLQDIGVVAMLNALGDEYVAVLAKAVRHQDLSRIEAEVLEVTHTEVGAMLAERWKLPKDLVMPVRYHERPTAAPQDYSDRCRCVGLANVVHDVLSDEDPREAFASLYDKADKWFGLDAASVDALIRRCGDATRELSRLFNLDTGTYRNVDEIMQQAADRQAHIDPGEGAEASESGEVGSLASLLKDSSEFDPLTGVYARGMFNSLIRTALEGKPSDGKSPMLLQVSLDSATLEEPVSDEDADERIVRLANVLARQFGPQGVAVCRLSHELFAVVLSASDDRLAHSTIESVQKELGTIQPTMSISFGAARFGGTVKSAHELVVAATKSLQANRQRAKNSVSASKAA